jgi:nucleoside-diphosphate-sugar epimerase
MIIVTGAFGLLGREVLLKLADRKAGRKIAVGHRDPVVVVEHPRARVPRGFRHMFRGREAFRFIRADLARRGSVTSALDRALSQMPRSELSEPRALLHLGALIPPAADRNPDLARAVNVDGSNELLEWVGKRCPDCRFIYASSISVYGDRRGTAPIEVDDPLLPGEDAYARTKVDAERLVQAKARHWNILRFSYLVSSRKLRPDPLMFRMPLDTVIEICHARDAAAAVLRAAEIPAEGRVYHIAGGRWCRSTYREYLEQMFGIFGLAPQRIPRELFETGAFHCGAMDTDASQRDLNFQRCSLTEYYREVFRKKAWLRPLVYRFRFYIWRRILSGSRYFASLEEGLRSRMIMSLMNCRISS